MLCSYPSRLFAYITREAVETFGTRGEKAIVQAVHRYGLQRACTEGFGLLRNEPGLRKNLEQLERLEQQLNNACGIKDTCTAYNMEWLKAIQCENLLICCKAGVTAALERRESRGCHMRSDYPEVDHDNYLIKYVFRQEDGKMLLSVRKPRRDKTQLPTGTRKSILDYLTDPDLDYRR